MQCVLCCVQCEGGVCSVYCAVCSVKVGYVVFIVLCAVYIAWFSLKCRMDRRLEADEWQC